MRGREEVRRRGREEERKLGGEEERRRDKGGKVIVRRCFPRLILC